MTRATAISPAYAALPSGTLWRIAENAGLNSAAMYAALSPELSNDAKTKVYQLDVKASREIGQLPGGPLGIAIGAEARHESAKLDPTTGTDIGDVIGLGYSAYAGYRRLYAAYGELAAPLTKNLELSAALRADHYSTVGGSVTPKIGFKWTPMKELALRGTFAEGFRSPSVAENGVGGLAFFTTATDPIRCALGVAAACAPASVAGITSPNPALKPETSRSYTLGLVFEPTSKTSIAVDLFQIDRANEINQETTSAAILAGHVSRDPTSATATPGDPGPITAVLVNYVNSSSTTVRGLDLDAKQGLDFEDFGRVTLDAKWTHLFTLKRTDPDGSSFDFAGTHGNCDATNCMGTPADRVNLGATWERGAWRVGANLNFRASMDNKLFKNDPAGCASIFADGSDAPGGCKIGSFTTVDLNARWKPTEQLEVFGGIQNLLDRKPPLDPLTYGAQGYNPLDFSGAVGRFYSLGVKYKF